MSRGLSLLFTFTLFAGCEPQPCGEDALPSLRVSVGGVDHEALSSATTLNVVSAGSSAWELEHSGLDITLSVEVDGFGADTSPPSGEVTVDFARVADAGAYLRLSDADGLLFEGGQARNHPPDARVQVDEDLPTEPLCRTATGTLVTPTTVHFATDGGDVELPSGSAEAVTVDGLNFRALVGFAFAERTEDNPNYVDGTSGEFALAALVRAPE